LRKVFLVLLTCIIVSSTTATSQTRRRSSGKSRARTTKAATVKPSADIKLGREQVATQIKTLTHFVYLLGGIAKGVESVELAIRNKEASPGAIEQNTRNKTVIRQSLKTVREGLDKLETDFRFNSALLSYNPYIAGVSRLGETAENQASAGRFDEAGRTLLKAVGQLADALAAMQ
jgi:hypothetical protein